MKYIIVLFALNSFFAVTLFSTPVDLLASSKRGLDGWYHAKASFKNNNTHLMASDDNDGVNIRSSSVNAQITFYTGQDLLDSACYGRDGLPRYNAKDSDFIAAMRMTHFEHCFQCLRVERGHRHVIVKVIDKCGGCPQNAKNVDLTKAAFTKLATLDEGRVNIRWHPVSCPKRGKWPTFEKN